MKLTREIMIEGTKYIIVLSDEREALLAAKAAGRAILGLYNPGEASGGMLPAPYAADLNGVCDLSEQFLERVIQRQIGLPWTIAETKRLLIREFRPQDAGGMCQEKDGSSALDFTCEEELGRYIDCQYQFYEYGIWAVIEKESGQIIGKAGITNLELSDGKLVQEIGYHIFTAYRRKGYAIEACNAIMRYACTELELDFVYARTDASNEASVHLIQRLGFDLILRENGLELWRYPGMGHSL